MKHVAPALLGILSAAAASFFYYANRIEPNRTEIRHVTLRLPRLHPAFDGYRLVQISDVHSDSWMTSERLCRLIDQVNAQRPDLVAMTGDFVTNRVRYEVAELVVAFRRLQPRDGTVAILGNHDYRANPDHVRKVIRLSGLIDLSNKVHTLRRGEGSLHICGVDDIWAQQARLDIVLNALPDNSAAILLAHEPDFADIAAATGRFDLQLSGHSHGAQINIPVLRKWGLPVHGQRYYNGLYYAKEMAVYSNRGLGMVGLPLRFRARPEITVFTLRC